MNTTMDDLRALANLDRLECEIDRPHVHVKLGAACAAGDHGQGDCINCGCACHGREQHDG